MKGAGWKDALLGTHVEIQTGFPFKSKDYTDDPNGIALLRGDNIVQGQLRWEGVKRWPVEDSTDFNKYLLRKDDVVLAMDRPWIEAGLKYAWITKQDLPCLLVQRVARLRGINGLSTQYARYIIGHYSFTDYVKGIWTGVAVPHISESQIRAFQFQLPPTQVQARITDILSAYDDLIENNTRRIKILEQMAQMLYREWFVNFRFPGHEKVKVVESELGPAPEGWCRSYSDNVDFLEGPGLRKWDFRDEGIPFLNVRNIIDNDFDMRKRHCVDVESGTGKYRHFLLAEGDHVVSSSGTLGRVATVRKQHLPLMLNTGIIRMRVKTPAFGKWQIKHFLTSDYFQKQILSFAMGVAQIHFGPSHLKRMKVIVPPRDIGQRYEALVDPIESLASSLLERNINLRTTRDLLLPKLVSGEVSVETLEEEAVAETV